MSQGGTAALAQGLGGGGDGQGWFGGSRAASLRPGVSLASGGMRSIWEVERWRPRFAPHPSAMGRDLCGFGRTGGRLVVQGGVLGRRRGMAFDPTQHFNPPDARAGVGVEGFGAAGSAKGVELPVVLDPDPPRAVPDHSQACGAEKNSVAGLARVHSAGRGESGGMGWIAVGFVAVVASLQHPRGLAVSQTKHVVWMKPGVDPFRRARAPRLAAVPGHWGGGGAVCDLFHGVSPG